MTYSWDNVQAQDYNLPMVDADLTPHCRILGGGDGKEYLGLRILKEQLAHIVHADIAHPWTDKTSVKEGLRPFREECLEVYEQFYCGRFFESDDLADKETIAHLLYELGDLDAVIHKLQRLLLTMQQRAKAV